MGVKALLTVYRAGPACPGEHRGEVADLYATSDTFAPTGSQGRTGAVFASPTLAGVTRWVLGNHSVGAPVKVSALRVHPAGIAVYSVEAWEAASTTMGRNRPERHAAYWDTGIALDEWDARAARDGLDGRDWEVLVPPAAIVSVRPVAAGRVIEAAGHRSEQVQRVLQPGRRRRLHQYA